jgi:hypothetical protein
MVSEAGSLAGQMIGYLAEPDPGKIHKIAAHEWNRDDADVAFVTGWFSVAHAWGRLCRSCRAFAVRLSTDRDQGKGNSGTTAGPPETQLDRCLAPVQDDAVASTDTTGTKPRSF